MRIGFPKASSTSTWTPGLKAVPAGGNARRWLGRHDELRGGRGRDVKSAGRRGGQPGARSHECVTGADCVQRRGGELRHAGDRLHGRPERRRGRRRGAARGGRDRDRRRQGVAGAGCGDAEAGDHAPGLGGGRDRLDAAGDIWRRDRDRRRRGVAGAGIGDADRTDPAADHRAAGSGAGRDGHRHEAGVAGVNVVVGILGRDREARRPARDHRAGGGGRRGLRRHHQLRGRRGRDGDGGGRRRGQAGCCWSP